MGETVAITPVASEFHKSRPAIVVADPWVEMVRKEQGHHGPVIRGRGFPEAMHQGLAGVVPAGHQIWKFFNKTGEGCKPFLHRPVEQRLPHPFLPSGKKPPGLEFRKQGAAKPKAGLKILPIPEVPKSGEVVGRRETG